MNENAGGVMDLPIQDLDSRIMAILDSYNKLNTETAMEILVSPGIKKSVREKVKHEFRIPEEEEIIGVIDWAIVFSYTNGLAFCTNGIYGHGRKDGSNAHFKCTYEDIARMQGGIENNNSKIASMLNSALGDAPPIVRQQIQYVMSLLQLNCANYFPKPLETQDTKITRLLSDAEELMLVGDWNSLYTLAKSWLEIDSRNEFPHEFLLISCLFTTPPQSHVMADYDKESRIYEGQLLMWLKDQPYNVCRNLLIATVLSETDVQEGIRLVKEELKKHQGSEAATMLGSIYEVYDPVQSKIYYEKSIELGGNCAYAQYGLARIAQEEGHSDRSKMLLMNVISDEGTFVEAEYAMARIYSSEGDADNAVKHLNNVIRNDQDGAYGKQAAKDIETIEKKSSSFWSRLFQ